jgi:predicted nucleic acid-binding protein
MVIDTDILIDHFHGNAAATVFIADEPLAWMAGAYLNQYAAGHGLDLGDALIAATARATASELYTRNLRHYPMDDIVVKAPYERGR